jgi:LmbE family N-acetylglucosaminyl deacetylase
MCVLGVHRLVWLGYDDSGMNGWEQNKAPNAFINADTEAAAQNLPSYSLKKTSTCSPHTTGTATTATPITSRCTHVGHRAAEIANITNVYEMTMNRDHWKRLMEFAPEGEKFNPDEPADDGNPMGEPEANISHKIDVTEFCELKRQAIKCHASQITDTGFLGTLTPEMFEMSFGFEWFIKVGESGPPRDAWLFD